VAAYSSLAMEEAEGIDVEFFQWTSDTLDETI
jgi:hypothetical protein